MTGRISERRVFPSGDFDALPAIGVPRRQRMVTVDRARCVAIGVVVGIVIEVLAK